MTDYFLRSSDGSDGDDGLTWANAKATLAGILAVPITSSDVCYVQNTHAESFGANTGFEFPEDPGFRLISVSDTNEPPTTLAAMTALTEGWVTSGNFNLRLQGSIYGHGLSFIPSNIASNNSGDMILGNDSAFENSMVFESTIFGTQSTSTTAQWIIGTGADTARFRFTDCTWRPGATNQEIVGRGNVLFQNLSIINNAPTTLFQGSIGIANQFMIENSDLDTNGPTNLVARAADQGLKLIVRNCKLKSGVSLITGTSDRWDSSSVEVFNSDSADTNYRYASDFNEGTVDTETTITRTGGAEHGGTQYSFKMVSSANSEFAMPLESPEFVIWNATTGSSITVTVQATGSELLQNDDFWMEIQYLGTSGFPQGVSVSGRVALLGSPANLPNVATAWDSDPASVQDMQLALTFTPQEVGFVHCKVMLAKPSITVYVDPLPVVT